MAKYCVENIISAKGHLNQERQGLQSTKKVNLKLFNNISNKQVLQKDKKQYIQQNDQRCISHFKYTKCKNT